MPYGSLKPLLEILSPIVAHDFDEWEWDAIRFGIADTADAAGAWFVLDRIMAVKGVRSYQGGMNEWEQRGLPVTPY